MKRSALCLVLVLFAAARPDAAQARPRRQWIYAVGGVAFGLGMTAIYSGSNYSKSLGWCSSVKCVGIFSTLGGGLVGYLIGTELDGKYRQRYRLAPPVEFPSRTRMLRTRATGFELDQDLLAVLGDEGVELITAGPPLEYVGHRARGLRDISDVGVRAEAASLLVGTGTGLYLYSVSGRTEGVRTLGGEVTAVAARGARIAVATTGVLRIGAPSGDTLVWRADTSALDDRAVDLRWQNDTLLWVLLESGLHAYAVSADSAPIRLGSLSLTGSAHRLAVGAGTVAVAAGAEGVYLLDTADPAAPRIAAHWTDARFVYDVAFWGADRDLRVFAAAGPEGLYVLEPGDGRMTAVGLVSNAGFVAALASGPDALYVLDRTGGVLRRLDPRQAAALH